jgi:uncharacterized protein (UPF0332 family)
VTGEQQALLEKARRGLAAARLLHENEQYEFAVERAYYVMFYAAEALLLEDGLRLSKHSAVIAAIGERFAKTRRVPSHFHRYLIRGQEVRHAGDYDTEPVSEGQSAEQLRRAEEFLEMAEQVLGAGD